MTKITRRWHDQHKKLAKVFLRMDGRKKVWWAKDFEKASYPMAIPRADVNWRAMHDWCVREFTRFGQVEYCWTGEKFWFLTVADRDKFLSVWGPNAYVVPPEGALT